MFFYVEAVMNQLKPNWRIAQQISKRHTFISLSISLSLCLGIILLSLITLKLFGIPNSGAYLKAFVTQHKNTIFSIAFFIHFVPINYYAIMKVFAAPYPNFELKIISK